MLQIRFYINHALTRQKFAKGDGSHLSLAAQRREGFLEISNSAKKLVEVQDKIVGSIRQLLSKERRNKEVQFFGREYHWLQLPKDGRIATQVRTLTFCLRRSL